MTASLVAKDLNVEALETISENYRWALSLSLSPSLSLNNIEQVLGGWEALGWLLVLCREIECLEFGDSHTQRSSPTNLLKPWMLSRLENDSK